MSLIFGALGFTVTEHNAKYLLSGYNTMNEEERKKVDLKAYIPYFRKFHISLGVSFFALGTALHYLSNKNMVGIFLAVYPILSYIYFIATSSKYVKGVSTTRNKAGVFILVGTLLFVICLFGFGFKEDKLMVDSKNIAFEGSYGETLDPTEIQSVELVSQLPEITLKTNGFALGTINKGYFKTDRGEIVKLILNSDRKPIILLTKTDGKKIYYSSKDKANEEVVNEMKKTLPHIVYK